MPYCNFSVKSNKSPFLFVDKEIAIACFISGTTREVSGYGPGSQEPKFLKRNFPFREMTNGQEPRHLALSLPAPQPGAHLDSHYFLCCCPEHHPKILEATDSVLGHIIGDFVIELLRSTQHPRSWKIPRAEVI